MYIIFNIVPKYIFNKIKNENVIDIYLNYKLVFIFVVSYVIHIPKSIKKF